MEQRQDPERRRRPRGGRRASDHIGYTPLVFVVDTDARRRDICEAILARLRFAVAPFDSSERALSVLGSLRPEVVVAGSADYTRLRDPIDAVSTTQGIPLVEIPDGGAPEAIVDAVRAAIRAETGPH